MMTKEQIEEIKCSYLTKEDFIKILKGINFSHVKNIHINLITSFKIKVTDKGDEYVDPLYIDIDID